MFSMIKSAQLKRDILDIGWDVLAKEGREALRMRDLATKSGCAVGTLYNLFENLEEIVLLLNGRYLDTLYGSLHCQMREGIERKESLTVLLKRLGKTYFLFGIDTPLVWKSLFENISMDGVPKWYREKVEQGTLEIEKTLVKAYGLEKEKSRQLVHFFWAAMHGMTAIILNKKGEEMDLSILDTYMDQCLRGFIE